MGNPLTATEVASYNSNPPPDDGTQVPENEASWADIKTKLTDPIKTAFDTSEAATVAALAKLVGGGGVTSTSISYEVVAGDQGKLVRATQSGVTITTPSATVVGSPFVFEILNNSTGDITVDGNGSQTINGEATYTVPKSRGLLLWTDGSNWFGKVTWHAELRALPFSTPRGRLTISTGVAVITSDVTAADTVYFTPYQGNTIMLPDANGDWALYEFAELSQALSDNTKSPSAATTDSLYDMFVWSDSGTIRCTRGPAWTSATGRGTGAGTTQISLVDGVYCNTVAISNGPGAGRGVYVGTIATNGSTQLAMMLAPSAGAGGSANRLDVWNMYNRVDVSSMCRDSTNTWTYTTATWRSANAAAGSGVAFRVTFVRGLNEDSVRARYSALASHDVANRAGYVGVGLDATDAFTGLSGGGSAGASGRFGMTGSYEGIPGLGRHFLNAVEYSAGDSTMTWYGDDNAPTIVQTGLLVSTRM